MKNLFKISALSLMLGGSLEATELKIIPINDIALTILHQAPREVQSYFGDYREAEHGSLISANYTDWVKKSLEDQVAYLSHHQDLYPKGEMPSFELDTLSQILKGNLDILNKNEAHGLLTIINPWYQATYTSFIDPLEYISAGLSDFILRGGEDNLSYAKNRFKEYVHGDGTNPGLIEGIIGELRRLKEKYEKEGKQVILPCQQQLQKIIASGYIKEIINWIKSSLALQDDQIIHVFDQQMVSFVAFIKEELLPFAPKNPRLPRDVYEALLKVNGISQSPEELIQRAHHDFDLLYQHFIDLAQKIAEKHHFSYESPVQVLKKLAQEPGGVLREEDALKMYQEVQGKIEKIIKENKLITLSDVPLVIRQATPAEIALLNAPQYRPPELYENHSNKGEFVTTGWQEFNHPFSAAILLAHEGRPGHDQQFSKVAELLKEDKLDYISGMLIQQMPYIEGWGLYAEDLIMPYLSLEEQLGGLKMRLLRIARMFLDPEVNTGKISFEDIIEFLKEKLGFEEAHARVEAERYSFKMPAQAITYYYGLTLLLDLRKQIEDEMGPSFDLGKFNDSILRCGFMPVDKMKPYVLSLMTS